MPSIPPNNPANSHDYPMQARSRPNYYVSVGLASFFILATINTIVTTAQSKQIVLLLRPILATMIVLCITANVLKRGITVKGFLGLSAFLVASIYGIIVCTLTNSLQMALESLFIDVPMILSGIYLLSAVKTKEHPQLIQDRHVKFFIYYSIFATLATMVLGGVIFGVPPQFNFEYGSNEIGREQTYSLGLTNFYGLATIAAAYMTTITQGRWRSFLMGALMLTFLSLSLLGGGRGELIATIFIVALILAKSRPVFTVSLIAAAGAMLALFVSDWSNLTDSLIITQRLTDLAEGDLSSRDSLLHQVGNLLGNEPMCLLFGCGPGFFQTYYHYDFGTHPHNVFAESVISFGVVLTVAFLVFVGIGVRKYWRSVRRIDPFLLMVLFLSIVALKSSYLMGSWVLVACYFHLATLATQKRAATLRTPQLTQTVH